MNIKEKELRSYLIDDKTILKIPVYKSNDRDDEYYGSIFIGNNRIDVSACCSTTSCGIYEWSGISLDSHLNNIKPLIKSNKYDIFIDGLFKEYFRRIKKKENLAWITASTNSNGGEIISILDRIFLYKTRWKINPNSGNKIKMWIL